MPAFLSWSSATSDCTRETPRWNVVASAMASLIHFCSAGERPSQNFLLTMTACGLYMWRVMARCFCTSLNLDERMVVTGFSCPSTAFCSSAVYSSGKGMGTALAPRALNMSM